MRALEAKGHGEPREGRPGPAASPAASLRPGARGKEGREGYLAAKRPAANEPGAPRTIFSSRTSGRLIAPAGSR